MDPTNTPPIAVTPSPIPAAVQPDVAASNSAPIMDIVVQKAPAAAEVPAPVTDASPETPIATEKVTENPLNQTTKQPHVSSAAKPKSSGVGAAITATVVIILSLAAMAVYAFLQT